MLLPQLRQLGLDYERTVRLLRIPLVVTPMVLFRRVKGIQWHKLGHDGRRPQILGAQFGDQGGRDLLLLLRVEEDGRAIVRTDVSALSVEGCWVMDQEEHQQQVVVAHDLGIEGQLDRLGVSRLSGADLLVAWVRHGPAGEPGLDLANTTNLQVGGLQTPETSSRQRRFFFSILHDAAATQGPTTGRERRGLAHLNITIDK